MKAKKARGFALRIFCAKTALESSAKRNVVAI